MTKYKKLTRSSFVIVALCLALVGILAFGGTYAYFSANASASGNVSMGTLKVKLNNGATTLSLTDSEVVPNQQVFDGSTVTLSYDTTDINFYVRIKFSASVEGEITPGAGEPTVEKALSVTGFSGWVKSGDYYYLGTAETATKATGTTAPTTVPATVAVAKEVGANGSTAYMAATIKIEISVETIQADYLAISTNAGSMSVETLAGVWDGYVATKVAA